MATAAVSRRINAERLMLVGWLRALLLQIAHPLIAAGVAEHSSFRGSTKATFSRLHQTVAAMLAIAFGSPQQRDEALDGIRAIHRRVNGRLAEACGVLPAGTRYSAEDPNLLLWVHATLIESVVLTYEQLVAPLSAADRDLYCADSANVAVELGAHADTVPRSWTALQAYLDSMYASGEIAVGPQARTLAAVLVSPVRSPLARCLVQPLMSVLAAGQLPAIVRVQYGLAWNPSRAQWFARLMTLLRLLRRAAPRSVAHWKVARTVNCLPARHGYSAAR